jgi:hypothetical protein
MSQKTIYIGVQINSGKHPFTYAAITADRRLFALGQGPIEELLFFASGQADALMAINSPQRPNLGLMRTDEVRHSFNPLPPPRLQDLRLAEFLLRIQGLKIPSTSSEVSKCPAWIQAGFDLYRRLQELDYHLHVPDGGTQSAAHRYLETQAEVAFWSLLGSLPLDHGSLESRLQRQLVLYLNDLPVADPMEFFEEITRHRLLQGNLPLKKVCSGSELDAMAAALTAWLADNRPARVKRIGDAKEGEIFLPLPDARR